MSKFSNRLPMGIMAFSTIFFAVLTYGFNFYGDGGPDGLGMFFFIIIAGIACLGFLLLFIGMLLFTNKGDTKFKFIITAIVLLVVGFIAAQILNPSHGEAYEVETTTVIE